MARRNREVNIFNMSLLDILCGALGAFCFMMIALLPYYKPPGKEAKLQENQQKVEDLLQQLDEMKEKMADPAMVEQMQALMQQLEEQIKGLQGQLNQTLAQNEQLTADNQALEKENGSLRMREPFLVWVYSDDLGQDVDVYLEDNLPSKVPQTFDPTNLRGKTVWAGDMHLWHDGRGVAAWAVRDSPSNVRYKVFVKYATEPQNRRPISVGVSLYTSTKTTHLTRVSLTPERPWRFFGTIFKTVEGEITFEPGTEADNDELWQKLPKEKIPAKPSPSPGKPD